MGFRIEPTQSPAIAAQAGAIVGASQRAQIEAKQTYEAQQQEQHDATQFQQALELHRIQQADAASATLRQLDKEKQMAVVRDQADIERFKEAQKWDIEKMRVRSQDDFALEEKKYQRNETEYAGAIKSIDDNPYVSPDVKERMKFEAGLKYGKASVSAKTMAAATPQTFDQDMRTLRTTSGAKDLPAALYFYLRKGMVPSVSETTAASPTYQSALASAQARLANAQSTPGTVSRVPSVAPAQTQSVAPTGLVTPAAQPTPLAATNKTTGQRLISYDGGKTWQPLQ